MERREVLERESNSRKNVWILDEIKDTGARWTDAFGWVRLHVFRSVWDGMTELAMQSPSRDRALTTARHIAHADCAARWGVLPLEVRLECVGDFIAIIEYKRQFKEGTGWAS